MKTIKNYAIRKKIFELNKNLEKFRDFPLLREKIEKERNELLEKIVTKS